MHQLRGILRCYSMPAGVQYAFTHVLMSDSTIIIAFLETDLVRPFPIEDPSAGHHELDQTPTDTNTEDPMNRIPESHSLHHRG